ncbi:HEAT repeat domain-containing protein [Novosphingobium naphthalenivorans]|uniref:HEAT repeat domain-containing protein n=1 Tax=Novosphingobium naphthalenivorans TaxID=273168 RepID=UPI000A04AA97|nr:HEAT repeat domain-containing protein [Novosphingobium naphthalenivorans]
MKTRYLPSSDFLPAIINEDAPFNEGNFGERNLERLIGMTRDPDTANRDWATLLLSQLKLDRPDVREALIAAAADEAFEVRGEAILGIAQLDQSAALPLLRKEL